MTARVIDIQPYRERRERRDLEELHDMIEGEMKPLDADIAEVVNKRFWDLIGLNEEPTETTEGWLITFLNEEETKD